MTAREGTGSHEWDIDAGENLDEDPGDELEALIERSDGFASETFGTTADEQEHGESLDERLAEERPSRTPSDVQLAIEELDGSDEESELVADASLEHDPFVSPEEAAMNIRERAPGAVDHPDDHGDVGEA